MQTRNLFFKVFNKPFPENTEGKINEAEHTPPWRGPATHPPTPSVSSASHFLMVLNCFLDIPFTHTLGNDFGANQTPSLNSRQKLGGGQKNFLAYLPQDSFQMVTSKKMKGVGLNNDDLFWNSPLR